MAELGSNWYTAYTMPNFERKVNDELSKKDIESYLPLHVAFRKWSDRVKKIRVPLFRNYIFINTTEARFWEVLNVRGILTFIDFEGRPAVISTKEIDIIKKLENEPVDIEPGLVEGTRVKINRGHLAGICGLLYSKKGGNRFGIYLDSMKQSLSLEVPASYLEKV